MPPDALALPALEPPAPDHSTQDPTDWILARTLYASGVATPTIAKSIGVSEASIRMRIMRENWLQLRHAVQAKAVTSLQTVIEHSISPELRHLMESSAKTKQALAHELLANIDTLSSTPRGKKLVTQKLRADTLSTLAQAGKVIHAWGESDRAGAVQVTNLQAAIIVRERASAPSAEAQSPVLEAECTSSSTPDATPPASEQGMLSPNPTATAPTPSPL